MPALNFTVFTDQVSDGRKCHTIRKWRKVPFKNGDELSFFTGMRTKKCRRLRPNAVCTSAMPIAIATRRREVFLMAAKGSAYSARLRPDGMLNAEEIDLLAKNDGFKSVDAFFQFFGSDGFDFAGQLVEWAP